MEGIVRMPSLVIRLDSIDMDDFKVMVSRLLTVKTVKHQ